MISVVWWFEVDSDSAYFIYIVILKKLRQNYFRYNYVKFKAIFNMNSHVHVR